MNDDLIAQLYRERFGQPVRSKNSLEPYPQGYEPESWSRLHELREGLRETADEVAS